MVDLLQKSGWAPDRRIDISSWVSSLREEGWSDPVGLQSALLESLGGLTLHIQRRPNACWAQASIEIDPIGAAGTCDRRNPQDDPAHILYLQNMLSESLYPFAIELVSAPVTLYLTPSGRLVAAGSDMAYSFGVDFESSFHNLTTQCTKPNELVIPKERWAPRRK
jgi:hypothetical protein